MLKRSISQHCSSIVRLTAMSFVLAGLLVSCGRDPAEAVSTSIEPVSASVEPATAEAANEANKANEATWERVVYSHADRSDGVHEYLGISYVYGDGELEQITYEHLPASTPVHFVMPDGVTGIGPRAFRDCPGLESVAIPNSVNLISTSAFQNLAKLKTVSLPVHASIGGRAFEGCTKLERVTLTEGGAVAPLREDA